MGMTEKTYDVRIANVCTTSRWSSSSAGRWPTTSPICCWTPSAGRLVEEKGLDWIDLLEQEPDAGLGNGGLGRLAACFMESAATLQLPAMGYGLRYQYGIFKQSIRDGWQQEKPDHWLRWPDPWEVARPNETVEMPLNCSFELNGGSLHVVPGRPSTLIGIPFDRPIVGLRRITVNTLRLWDADAPDFFDFAEFSSGDFVDALAETLSAETLTRVLYPDDSTSAGQGLRLLAGVLPCCLLAGRCGAPLQAQQLRLEPVSRRRLPFS